MMPPSTPFLLRRASLCSSLRTSLYASLLLALPALAQSPYDLIHQVQPGDTLIALAQHYLGDARQWPQLQSANPMSEPRRLRPGSPLRIPMQLLPLGTAQVAFVQGDARISPANGPSANGTPGNLHQHPAGRWQRDPGAGRFADSHRAAAPAWPRWRRANHLAPGARQRRAQRGTEQQRRAAL
jgi:hypothetical protein